jgi:hypothetical protein
MAASKSSSATALLLAALLLFAATIALAQTPPEPEDEEPGCPTAADLDPVIVNSVLGRQQTISDSLQEMIDELSTTELGECICERIIPATGITSGGTAMVVTGLTNNVLKSLDRNIPLNFECNL